MQERHSGEKLKICVKRQTSILSGRGGREVITVTVYMMRIEELALEIPSRVEKCI